MSQTYGNVQKFNALSLWIFPWIPDQWKLNIPIFSCLPSWASLVDLISWSEFWLGSISDPAAAVKVSKAVWMLYILHREFYKMDQEKLLIVKKWGLISKNILLGTWSYPSWLSSSGMFRGVCLKMKMVYPKVWKRAETQIYALLSANKKSKFLHFLRILLRNGFQEFVCSLKNIY